MELPRRAILRGMKSSQSLSSSSSNNEPLLRLTCLENSLLSKTASFEDLDLAGGIIDMGRGGKTSVSKATLACRCGLRGPSSARESKTEEGLFLKLAQFWGVTSILCWRWGHEGGAGTDMLEADCCFLCAALPHRA